MRIRCGGWCRSPILFLCHFYHSFTFTLVFLNHTFFSFDSLSFPQLLHQSDERVCHHLGQTAVHIHMHSFSRSCGHGAPQPPAGSETSSNSHSNHTPDWVSLSLALFKIPNFFLFTIHSPSPLVYLCDSLSPHSSLCLTLFQPLLSFKFYSLCFSSAVAHPLSSTQALWHLQNLSHPSLSYYKLFACSAIGCHDNGLGRGVSCRCSCLGLTVRSAQRFLFLVSRRALLLVG